MLSYCKGDNPNTGSKKSGEKQAQGDANVNAADPSKKASGGSNSPAASASISDELAKNCGTDLKKMTEKCLMQVPASTLGPEVEKLESALKRKKELVTQKQAINTRLCQKLVELQTKCLSHTYLVPPASDSLGCSHDNSDKRVIKVVLSGGDNRRFRLSANNKYYSNEFGDGSTNLTFEYKKKTYPGQIMISPTFSGVANLALVQVTESSTIDKGTGILSAKKPFTDSDKAAENIKLNIFVGSRRLGGSEPFKLEASTKDSELNVPSSELQKITGNKECMVDISTIAELIKTQ